MNSFTKRLAILLDGQKGAGARFFAAAEMLCIPLSIMTIAALLVQSASQNIWAFDLFFWMPKGLLSILSTAAIGYLTNWLAIQMLFRPYNRQKWLFFWQQGLLPRNQEKIAKVMARTVVTQLLKPEALVRELGGKIHDYLEKPEVLEKIKESTIALAAKYGQGWARVFLTKLGLALEDILAKNITPETIYSIWDNYLAPKLEDEGLRSYFVQKMVAALKEVSPELSRQMQNALRIFLDKKMEKVPETFGIRDKVENAILSWASDETIRQLLEDFLGKPATIEQLKQIFILLATKGGEWIRSGEARGKINGFSDEIKGKILQMVQGYLEENASDIVLGLFKAPELWHWVAASGMPLLQDYLTRQIKDNTQLIVDNLQLDKKVENAVSQMSARQLHQMIDQLAAEHLGAIQVLGFILGGLIGVLQLLI